MTLPTLRLSYFTDRLLPLSLPSPFTISSLRHLTKAVCAGPQSSAWDAEILNPTTSTKSRNPSAFMEGIKELEERGESCLDFTFMLSLLSFGYELEEEREIFIGKKVRGVELGWCVPLSLLSLLRRAIGQDVELVSRFDTFAENKTDSSLSPLQVARSCHRYGDERRAHLPSRRSTLTRLELYIDSFNIYPWNRKYRFWSDGWTTVDVDDTRTMESRWVMCCPKMDREQGEGSCAFRSYFSRCSLDHVISSSTTQSCS